MRSKVTVVLVANQGGEWLNETVSGIRSQTRVPATLVAVNNGGGTRVDNQLREAGVDAIVALPSKVSFGRAVAQGVENRPQSPAASNDETDWFWLLSEDACPEPEALDHILARVEVAPSVVVAGPKLVDWDHPERIIELGQSLTKRGSRWLLRRQELDQQQYDHMQDVMGVGPVGMLVRADVWEQLGGFDPAYATYDDGLDFSVRTRLAGYRVEVAAESRVRFARSGVAGPRIDRSRSVLRQAHRQARTSHLHRRIAYAPAYLAALMWIGLPFLSIARVAWALIREQPGNMFAEFVSAWSVFLRPKMLVQSRKRVKAASHVGWPAIRQLRIDQKYVRTARMIDREAILAAQGRQKREIHFISTGGLAVLIATFVLAIGMTWWAIPHTSLIGGGMAPLSDFAELWHNTRMIDGVPADPFTWVLAVLGSLTFWNPSHALVILVIVAIPLSAMGAWTWAAQLTESRAGRAITALGFGLSPVLLGSIAAGRLTTLILAIVLPWLLLAATRCRESWSWAGTASLLAAVALACAPVLLPVALVFLVIGLFSSVRGIARVLTVAIAPAVLFAPKIIHALWSGSPLNIFMDPGAVSPFEPGNTWHLLLGFPEFGLEGWGKIFEAIGLGGAPATLLVGILMLPLALLALLGLYTGRIAVTVLSALFGGLGMFIAIMSSNFVLTTSGDTGVALWPGSGLALYWLAIVSLAALGAELIGRAAPAVISVAVVGALVAVGPLALTLATGNVPLAEQHQQTPAIVQAAGAGNTTTRTLVLTATGDRAVRAEVLIGAGTRMDQMRTADFRKEPTAQDKEIADLVGALGSVGDASVEQRLQDAGVSFVLLTPGPDASADAEMQRIFEQHVELLSAGSTEQGLLWRVADDVVQKADEGSTSRVLAGTNLSGHTIWIIQVIVLLGMFMLALPTGEVVEQPERRVKPAKVKPPKAAKSEKEPKPEKQPKPEKEPKPEKVKKPRKPKKGAVVAADAAAVAETPVEAVVDAPADTEAPEADAHAEVDAVAAAEPVAAPAAETETEVEVEVEVEVPEAPAAPAAPEATDTDTEEARS
ncbi:glycosyltransferase family 2 protein [Leucobacter sp. cx-42]|uniref:glycosyltransferase family 2 protein n=1 Tax=unclassified Leucobacter TaxID=2621730 RepID=UPI00165D57AE|nr:MULTISPECIES: glycosyltransferase [unclassified Leucobacter]MBC9953919.1 glycosyltransferase family 2 protein [Leucobacter sp. cx-42]